MVDDDKNATDLDKDSQECKDWTCDDNCDGSCTKDSEDYENCEHKTGD